MGFFRVKPMSIRYRGHRYRHFIENLYGQVVALAWEMMVSLGEVDKDIDVRRYVRTFYSYQLRQLVDFTRQIKANRGRLPRNPAWTRDMNVYMYIALREFRRQNTLPPFKQEIKDAA